jgi:hypothetical protein
MCYTRRVDAVRGFEAKPIKQLQAVANNPVTNKTWNQTTAFNSDKTLVLSISDR